MSRNACGRLRSITRVTGLYAFAWLLVSSVTCLAADEKTEERLKLVFLGDNGHHQPARRAAELLPVLAERGIDVRYSDNVDEVLSADNLKQLDGSDRVREHRCDQRFSSESAA